MPKAAVSRVWALVLRSTGLRYSKSPLTPPTLSAVVDSSTQITVTASGAASTLGSIANYRWRRNGALVNSGTPSGSPLVGTGLSPATGYTFTATAIDSAGNESAQSATITATTAASGDVTAPTAPGSHNVSVINSTTLRSAWIASADSGGSGLAGYLVERGPTIAGPFTQVTPTPITVATFDHTGLSPAIQYFARVRAIDNAGNLSPYSSISGATTAAASVSAYLWYPALDLSLIPFHAGSGAWGPQQSVVAPTAPNITRSATAANAAQLEAAMAVPGTRVTLTANITGGSANLSAITDIEVVIPNGIVVRDFIVGNNFTGTVTNRLRFTKASGDTIGGQYHNFRISGASCNDLVLDGLQWSGSASGNGLAIYFNTAVTRCAIVNNRIKSAGAGFGYGAAQFVVAGNSMQHDSDATNNSGDWGFRSSGTTPQVFYANDIRGHTYHKIRLHNPAVTGCYAWIDSNTLIDVNEARIFQAFNIDGNTSPWAGIWFTRNNIWADNSPTGNTPSCRFDIQTYARAINNAFRGVFVNGTMTQSGSSDFDITTGNTYAALGTLPAWGAAGDPTGINTSP